VRGDDAAVGVLTEIAQAVIMPFVERRTFEWL